MANVTPDRHGNNADAVLTLTGGGFDPTVTVELIGAGGTTHSTNLVEVDSYSQVTATFAAGSVPAGVEQLSVL